MAGPPTRADGRALPKRFYAAATAGAPTDGGFRILLDGRPVRTPAKAELLLPTKALAEAVAAEWAAQGTHVDPATMPMTRIVNSALDGVVPRRAEVEAEIVRYAGNDLVCYRAEAPAALAERQAAAWDGIIDWAASDLGVALRTGQGIAHVPQPPELAGAVGARLARLPVLSLAALHVITTLTGSALLALAHAAGRISAEDLWTAAHVDEDFQIEKWGWDAEAEARRERREGEMRAASRIICLQADRTHTE